MSVLVKGFGLGQRVITKGFGGILEFVIIKMITAISTIRRIINLSSK